MKNRAVSCTMFCVVQSVYPKGESAMEFMILAGGLLIIIIAVIVAVVASVTSAVAADQDIED